LELYHQILIGRCDITTIATIKHRIQPRSYSQNYQIVYPNVVRQFNGYNRCNLVCVVGIHTWPASSTMILLLCRTVFRRWAIVMTVQSAKHSWTVCWMRASVEVSMLAVASSSNKIWKQNTNSYMSHNQILHVFRLVVRSTHQYPRAGVVWEHWPDTPE